MGSVQRSVPVRVLQTSVPRAVAAGMQRETTDDEASPDRTGDVLLASKNPSAPPDPPW